MKINQIKNENGKAIPNQYVMYEDGKTTFQSYDATIATVDVKTREVVLYPKWDFSTTTGKYRNIFFTDYNYDLSDLGSKKGIETALKRGETKSGFKIRLEA